MLPMVVVGSFDQNTPPSSRPQYTYPKPLADWPEGVVDNGSDFHQVHQGIEAGFASHSRAPEASMIGQEARSGSA